MGASGPETVFLLGSFRACQSPIRELTPHNGRDRYRVRPWGKSCHIDKFRLPESDQDYHAETDGIATSRQRPAIRRITDRAPWLRRGILQCAQLLNVDN